MRGLPCSPRLCGLVACLVLFCVALVMMIPRPSGNAPPAQPAAAAASPAHGAGVGVILTVAGIGLAAVMAAGASTQAGTSDGRWEDAANWSNGVPTSTLSAIVSSTSGILVLPERTSATTKNLTGGGTLGLCGGGVNKLNIVAPSANTALRFVAVDHIEAKNATTFTPRGHD